MNGLWLEIWIFFLAQGLTSPACARVAPTGLCPHTRFAQFVFDLCQICFPKKRFTAQAAHGSRTVVPATACFASFECFGSNRLRNKSVTNLSLIFFSVPFGEIWIFFLVAGTHVACLCPCRPYGALPSHALCVVARNEATQSLAPSSSHRVICF